MIGELGCYYPTPAGSLLPDSLCSSLLCEFRISALSKLLPHISQRYCLGLLPDAAEDEAVLGIVYNIASSLLSFYELICGVTKTKSYTFHFLSIVDRLDFQTDGEMRDYYNKVIFPLELLVIAANGHRGNKIAITINIQGATISGYLVALEEFYEYTSSRILEEARKTNDRDVFIRSFILTNIK